MIHRVPFGGHRINGDGGVSVEISSSNPQEYSVLHWKIQAPEGSLHVILPSEGAHVDVFQTVSIPKHNLNDSKMNNNGAITGFSL